MSENFKVDLTNCDREPIHRSGAIQPHGVLFVLDRSSLRIKQLSTNTDSFFRLDPAALLGKHIDVVLDGASVEKLRAICELDESRVLRANPVRVTAAASAGGAMFDSVLRFVPEGLLVELESATSQNESLGGLFEHVRRAVSSLHASASVEDYCQRAAEEVRHMTGFDRVMTYRFDRNDNGHVIAEDKRAELESYLDLHYPASDIPAQARRLYTINHLRLIVNVAYEPVPIVTIAAASASASSSAQASAQATAQAKPLDLSFSVLRSVSPIHCEYLRNMGIHASMSISLVIDGRLWGLIICHHYMPRFVPFDIRAASEFLSQALAGQIATRERSDIMERRALVDHRLRSLVRAMSEGADLRASPAADQAALMMLVGASGCALVHGGTTTLYGATPTLQNITLLVTWLQARSEAGAFTTESLVKLLPGTDPATAAGLLAIPLTKEGGSYVLWFRPEVTQTVSWAGDPNKVASLKDGAPRLSPRGSFALWKETVRGQSSPWQSWEIAVAVDFGHALASLVFRRAAELERLNSELRATSDELRHANVAKDEFLATVSHELRTPLNAMLGWLSLMRTNELDPGRHAHALETVERNARAQAKLIEDLLDVSRIISGKMQLDLQNINFVEVVDSAVQAASPGAEARGVHLRWERDLQPALLVADSARLQQVVWNLLANAIKLTPKSGNVDVAIAHEEGAVTLHVTDTGEGIDPEFLPHVFERFRQAQTGAARRHQGLGLGLAIVRHLAELHGGAVAAFSAGKGLGARFTIRLPLSKAPLVQSTERAHGVAQCPPELANLRLLVVDDEPDAREIMDALLSRCGAQVHVAASGAEALRLLADVKPDLIISDIGMPDMDGYELLRAIRKLPLGAGGQTPAVALTAYARADDRARAFQAGFQAHTAKPIETTELFAVLVSLSARIAR